MPTGGKHQRDQRETRVEHQGEAIAGEVFVANLVERLNFGEQPRWDRRNGPRRNRLGHGCRVACGAHADCSPGHGIWIERNSNLFALPLKRSAAHIVEDTDDLPGLIRAKLGTPGTSCSTLSVWPMGFLPGK